MAKEPKDPTPALAALAPDEETAERAAQRRLAMRDPIEGNPMMLRLGSGSSAELVEVAPGRWRDMGLADPRTGLPPGCPVVALGISQGDAYFLNTLGEIVRLPGTQSGKRAGRRAARRPRRLVRVGRGRAGRRGPRKARPQVNGWALEVARHDLLRACWLRGIYDESSAVRGLGAWLAPRWRADLSRRRRRPDRWCRWREPGEFGGAIYPARRSICARRCDRRAPATARPATISWSCCARSIGSGASWTPASRSAGR